MERGRRSEWFFEESRKALTRERICLKICKHVDSVLKYARPRKRGTTL